MDFKRYHLLTAAFALLSLCACGSSDPVRPDVPDGSGGGETEGEYHAPDAPDNIQTSNLFRVAYYTNLSQQKLADVGELADEVNLLFDEHIASAVVLERSDVEIGVAAPHLDLAVKTRSYAFFSQFGDTRDVMQGSAFLSRTMVTGFDALWNQEVRMSGYQFKIQLVNPAEPMFYTLRWESLQQLESFFALNGEKWGRNRVVMATYPKQLRQDIDKILAVHLRDFRVRFMQSDVADYDLMVLSPLDYVCREFEAHESGKVPYYLITLEKL